VPARPRFTGAVAAATVGALAVLTAPAVAADCSADVAAASERQRKTPAFRMVAETKGDQGPVRMQIDYVPPDRMYQSVTHPSHPAPVETIAIGRWAWGTMGGGWEELKPQFAQSVTSFMRQALVEPLKEAGKFDCLGTQSIDGKDYVAFRSADAAPSAAPPDRGPGAAATAAATAAVPLARTVYVDPATGLPMLNVVAEAKPGAEPVFKGVFSYPTDLKIDAPIGDPNPKP